MAHKWCSKTLFHFLIKFRSVFKSIFEPKMDPKMDPQIALKPASAPQGRPEASREPFGTHLGPMLGLFWTHVGLISELSGVQFTSILCWYSSLSAALFLLRLLLYCSPSVCFREEQPTSRVAC